MENNEYWNHFSDASRYLVFGNRVVPRKRREEFPKKTKYASESVRAMKQNINERVRRLFRGAGEVEGATRSSSDSTLSNRRPSTARTLPYPGRCACSITPSRCSSLWWTAALAGEITTVSAYNYCVAARRGQRCRSVFAGQSSCNNTSRRVGRARSQTGSRHLVSGGDGGHGQRAGNRVDDDCRDDDDDDNT